MTHGCNEPGAVVGVVLAAGAGTRYGSPKVLVDDWLTRAVGAVDAGGCAPVMVTLGAAIVDVPSPASAVVVADWQGGISASVHAGVEAARSEPGVVGVLITLVDVPDVDAAVVARVLRSSGRSPDAVVRAVYDGRPGHPVYVGSAHLDALLMTLHGDRGAGPFLSAHPGVQAVECGDLATGHDVDRQ